MTDFYKDRKEAICLIRDMCNEGKEAAAIYYKVACLYGFGKKFVNEIIELDLSLKQKDIQKQKEDQEVNNILTAKPID